jgi:hypothetical protein
VLGVLFGLAFWLVLGLSLWLVSAHVAGLVRGLVLGLVGGLVNGLIFGLAASRTWPSALAMAQLAREWDTPVRLMKFLDDARERGVLRTAGPAWQFRHARLQDRLAEQAASPPHAAPTIL